MRRYDDPVEVRRDASADPEQFLWRGRLWQVREVVSHWVETGAWWVRAQGERDDLDGPGSSRDADLLREREVWRVAAARGRVGDQGVFDLVFSWSEGGWRLARAVD